MNKPDLIAAAAQQSGLAKKDAERCINAAIDTIIAALSKGEKVQLTGFGTFEVTERKARMGRDPRSHMPIQIPSAKVPNFKPCQSLKDHVAK